MEQKRQWYYRGSLKSCNYHCSYCPFCKKRSSPQAEREDERQLFQFIRQLEESGAGGAVLIVPYGEALIHPYYWEGLARLSRLPGIDAVGAQSNFSFPVDEMLEHYQSFGGKIEKLRLWGTFHPQMTSVGRFVSQCESLSGWRVKYCAGVVGVPEQIPDIRELREKLDRSVYLWVNRMDGMGRNYRKEELDALLAVDPWFGLELKHYPADGECGGSRISADTDGERISSRIFADTDGERISSRISADTDGERISSRIFAEAAEKRCGNQLFVEADGTLRRCNLCRADGANLYRQLPGSDAGKGLSSVACNRKECSCYLAYNNRGDAELAFFQPYPAFRIPTYPRAVFLDIDGTILPERQRELSAEMVRRIQSLAEHSRVYLATSLPVEAAMQKIHGISRVLAGGVFASGGRSMVFRDGTENHGYDAIAPVESGWLDEARTKQKEYGFRLHVYRKEEYIYKVTLSFPGKRFPGQEVLWLQFCRELCRELSVPESCRCFLEGRCIEVVRRDRNKLQGILEIMREMGYQRQDVMAFGNSEEDQEMMQYFR